MMTPLTFPCQSPLFVCNRIRKVKAGSLILGDKTRILLCGVALTIVVTTEDARLISVST